MTVTSPSASTRSRLYTPEEYLALEDKADFRSEYRQGEIIPMAGGTTNHNRIARNVSAELHFASKAQDEFENFIGDVKLWVPQEQLYTYPDVMAVVGEVEYYNDRRDIILNPQVIIEVLSKSTEDYDRLGKFSLYRTVPSFVEYILINQNRVQIEHFTKQGAKRWSLQDIDADDRELKLESIPFTMSLDEIYRKVNLADAEPSQKDVLDE
ncbi:Uma2 family endonuclease [Pseudanabaenaceae cyanobacterium LEGE 13415]|nr:Uma2 family endonuclease [Pseudanabaenaceae cyanobacterium LEGE 13415]